jgi:hypothetical protein
MNPPSLLALIEACFLIIWRLWFVSRNGHTFGGQQKAAMSERCAIIKYLSISVLFILILGLSGGKARSSDDATSRLSLSGIKGFSIKVERLDPEIEGDGLRAATIQADAEVLVKGFGIKILSKMESLNEPGEPNLYIDLQVLKLRATNEYIYSIKVAFRQNAYLSRTPIEVLSASTWSLGLVTGITPDLGKIRDSVKAQVQTFGQAFRSVNPK